MKAQTPKTVTRVPLDDGDHVPGFGAPDPDRVVPAHRRKQRPTLVEAQRDDRSAMAFQNAAQLAVGDIPEFDGIVEAADMPALRRSFPIRIHAKLRLPTRRHAVLRRRMAGTRSVTLHRSVCS